MIKTKEYQECYQWAKDAPLTLLVDALVDNLRYPSVIRDELRARLKPTPGLMVSDLLWDHFMRVSRGRESAVQEATQEIPGTFLIQLRDNKDFWRWAKASEDRGLLSKYVFANGAEKMWKKCFDPRLTNSPREKLTEGELRLIEAFDSALIGYNIEKEHNFQAFLNDGDPNENE